MSESSEPQAPRALGHLATLEALAVVAVLLAPRAPSLPVVVPLLVLATVSRWLRRRDWASLLRFEPMVAATSVGVGLAALIAALVAGTPVVEALSGRGVEWSVYPIVRGDPANLAVVALVVVAMSAATEAALRGWLVDRMLELSPGPATLPIAVGAVVEAAITDGGIGARFGGAVFGAGLGILYVASGRNLVAPICARVSFALGALVLEAMQWIG